MPEVEIHYEQQWGEWAALYVDGKLVTVGDNDNTEEKAFDVLGVRMVQDDAFMRGQDRREGVAQTLSEVAEYRAGEKERLRLKQERLDRAVAAMRKCAADLTDDEIRILFNEVRP